MKKILFVDDEPNILSGYQRQLRKQFPVETALGPRAGLEALQNWRDYAVVVSDMRMPEMNGVEFLKKVKETAPDVVRVMLTGNADQTTAIEAINEGSIFCFLNKPCPPEKLTQVLESGLRQHQLITAERDLLENTLRGCVKTLTDILAMVDPKSFEHAEALRDNIRRVAESMGISPTWEFEVAAMLAHVGFVTVPPEVMLKTRAGLPLSEKEQVIISRIPAIGGSLLAKIPRLEEVSRIILYQNKRFDGFGYPEDKVSAAEIPMGSRMLKILLDLARLQARGTARPAALEQLRGRQGWYDPQILDAVCACLQPAVSELASAHGAKQPLTVTFSALRVGHVLVSDIQTRDGTLILSAGNHITPALMQRLRNFAELSGIQEPIQVQA